MANGLLALPATGSPLETSLMQQQQPQPTPEQLEAGLLGGGQPAAPVSPGTPGDMSRLNQIYGLLAQYGDDPTAVGLQYARTLQQQQQQAFEQSDENRLQQFMGMLGNINPHDITPESIQDFYSSFMQGNVDFNLLKYRERLTDAESKMIATAEDKARDIQAQMQRAQQLAVDFEQLAREHALSGYPLDLKRWIDTALGTEDAAELIYKDFEDLKNQSVIANLPPGIASDTDIMIAMRGWTRATTNPAINAAFLRGRQKMLAAQVAYETHLANYLSKGLTRAGHWQAWEREKDHYIRRALEPYGGVNPARDLDDAYAVVGARYGTQAQEPAPRQTRGRGIQPRPTTGRQRAAATAEMSIKERRQQALERWGK